MGHAGQLLDARFDLLADICVPGASFTGRGHFYDYIFLVHGRRLEADAVLSPRSTMLTGSSGS
jgi:hypothetical protein